MIGSIDFATKSKNSEELFLNISHDCTLRPVHKGTHSPLNADVLHFIMFATKFGTSWALSSSEFELIRLMPRNLIGSGCK